MVSLQVINSVQVSSRQLYQQEKLHPHSHISLAKILSFTLQPSPVYANRKTDV